MKKKDIYQIKQNIHHLNYCCNTAFKDVMSYSEFEPAEKESLFYLISLKNIFTSLGINENSFDILIQPYLEKIYEKKN